ncbi:MAG: S1C family serine protease [Dongiaceae bacterium]
MTRFSVFMLVAVFTCILAACSGVDVKQAETREPLAVAEGKKSLPVKLSRITYNIKRNTPVGNLQTGLLCISKGALLYRVGQAVLREEDFDNMFREELKSNNYNVVGMNANMFAQDSNADERARFRIGGRIDDIKANVCYPLSITKASGEGYVKVTWQVFDNLAQEVVYETTTEGNGKFDTQLGGDFGEAVLQGFAAATNNLLADQKFHDILMGEGGQPTDQNPKSKAKTKEISIEKIPSWTSPIARNMEKVRAATVTVAVGDGHGSGFFIAPRYVLTNAHVVGEAEQVMLRTITGRKIVADVVSKHKARDIALLQTEDSGIAPLPLRTNEPAVGDKVFALGTPLDKKLESTLTSGIVSNYRNDKYRGRLLQHDATIQQGNSGGPVFDEHGNVIAVTVSGRAFGAMNGLAVMTGHNFSIPIADALAKLNIRFKNIAGG